MVEEPVPVGEDLSTLPFGRFEFLEDSGNGSFYLPIETENGAVLQLVAHSRRGYGVGLGV
jgi:hypothetical protein